MNLHRTFFQENLEIIEFLLYNICVILRKECLSLSFLQILIRVRYLILRYTTGTQKSFSRKNQSEIYEIDYHK